PHWRAGGGVIKRGTWMVGQSLVARALTLVAVVAFALLGTTTADAVVIGGCKVQATATKTGGQDLTSIAVWHVVTADVVSGTGTAPTEQSGVQIGAYVLGITFPIASSTDKGTSGSGGPYVVADYSKYARIIAVSGASSGCSGSITIVVDDVAALSTAAGIGGAALGALGTIGTLVALLR